MVVETEDVPVTVVLVTAEIGVVVGEEGVVVVLEVTRFEDVGELAGVAGEATRIIVAVEVTMEARDEEGEDETTMGLSFEILKGAPLSG